MYAFHVSPRKKRVGCTKGNFGSTRETHLPVRESGRLVKNPSIFVSRIEFVRDYQIVDGVALPRRMETSVNTRLVGKANLSIAFHDVSLAAHSQVARSGGGL